MSTKDHRVTFTIEADGLSTTVEMCPYEPSDRSRPCWPAEENGEPELESDVCTWAQWVEELGSEAFRPGELATVTLPFRGMFMRWDMPLFEIVEETE